MGRTLTALAAAAGLLHLDAATAFQFPVAARTRAGTAPTGGLRSAPLSARPSAGSLSMTVAPEGLDSLGMTKGAEVAAGGTGAAAGAGAEGEANDVSSSGVPAAVPAPPAAPKVEDESNFSELEKAFAEARRRSLAQEAEAKKQKPPAAAPPAADEAVASGASAVATPKAAAEPAKPAGIAPGKNEGAKLRTTAGQKKSPPVMKGTPPKEAQVVKIKSTPKALRDDLEADKETATRPKAVKAPAAKKAAPAAAKKKAAAPAAAKGGAFSLGAESLEEFFGLTKKPRLVSTTTPPSNEPEPTPMAELDPAAVESMITDNGLNEVTLKENFRQMEADAKSAQASAASAASATKKPSKKPTMTTSSSSAEADDIPDVAADEAKKIAAAAAKSAVALSPNPIVDLLSSAFKFDKFNPEDKPGPPMAGKKAADLRAAAKPKVEAEEEKETPPSTVVKPAASSEVAAPKPKVEEVKPEGGLGGLLSGMFGAPVSDGENKKEATKAAAAPATERPKVTPAAPKPKAAAPKAKAVAVPKAVKAAPKVGGDEEKKEGGLAGMLSGIFGAPVYDNEVDTIPKNASGTVAPAERPKVTPAAPKAKAAAPKAKAASVPKPVEAAPKIGGEEDEEKKEGGLAGVLSGMFGAPVYDDEVDTIPKKASGAPRAMAVFAPPPAPAKAPAKAPPAPRATAPAPASKKKDTAAAPSSSFLDGLFGGGDKKASPKAKVAPPPTPPAPAPAVKKEAPASSSMFDGLFGGGGDKAKSPAPTPAPKAKVATPKKAPVVAKATPKPTPSPSPSMFGGMFGGDKKKDDAKPVAPEPVPAPAPAPKPPAFNLFGMGGTTGDAKKTPSPKPKSAAAKKVIPSAKAAAAVPDKKASAASSGGGMFDFLGGSKASKKAAPPAPAPEPVKASSSNPFAGLFGGAGVAGTSAKKKPKRQPAPAPPPAPTPVVSRVKTMDDSFLRKVSVMLRRNQAKIKKFQQLTDRFRGGLIEAPAYYEGVEGLFGEDNVEEIIGPLLAALPENDKRKTLQVVYNKAQRAKNGEGEVEGGGLAGLFGGWGSKSKKGKEAAGKTAAATGAAAADPYAFAAAKLSDKDYQLFKTRTTLYARGGINARNYYDTLAKVFGDKGVSAQLPALLKALPQNKRKLLQDVVTGLAKK